MVRIGHVSFVLLSSSLLLFLLLSPELLNLLLQRVVFRHKNAVSLVSLCSILFHDKELVDNLIHGLVVRSDLRRFILFNDLSPVHILELVANVALTDDTL